VVRSSRIGNSEIGISSTTILRFKEKLFTYLRYKRLNYPSAGLKRLEQLGCWKPGIDRKMTTRAASGRTKRSCKSFKKVGKAAAACVALKDL